MLFLLHGLNGSGKSYHAVKDFLIPALKAGRPVITNLDGLDLDYISVYFDIPQENIDKLIHYPPPEDLFSAGSFDDPMTSFYLRAQKLEKCLIIFDEIQAYYPSVAWKENPHRTAFGNYVTQHRKLGHDFIALTPDCNKVDTQIRTIFHFNLHFKKASFLGQDNRYFVNFRYGSDFFGKPFKTVTGIYEQKYHRCYKSFRVDKEGETKYSKLRFFPKSLIAGALLALIGFVYAGTNWYKSKHREQLKTPSPAVVSTAPAGRERGRSHPREHVVESYTRFAGYNQEAPSVWRLFGCDGETLGFTYIDPTESGTPWASCAESGETDSSEATSGAL